MFKEGDFVKVRQATKLLPGEIDYNWAGEVEKVYQEENRCLISFDAQSIDALDDAYLKSRIKGWEEAFEYVFDVKDLEPMQRRDTDELAQIALDKLEERMDRLEDITAAAMEDLRELWINEFHESQYFLDQSEYQQGNSGFIIDTFIDYMLNYEDETPDEWSIYSVKEVCLNIVPRKVSSEIELFENYGIVLQQFFKFLKEKKYINNANAIIKALIKITPKIPLQANNPSNWGMAKSFVMEAQSEGIDFADKEELNSFVVNKNLEVTAKSKQNISSSPKNDPFKGIGRNEKISVKYEDGKMLENIKFKKVEQDLKNGICFISK